MRSLEDNLKLIVIQSQRHPEFALETLREIGRILPNAENNIRTALNNLEKRLKKKFSHAYTHDFLEVLLVNDIVKRRRVKEYELNVPKEDYMRALDNLEKYFRDNTFVVEGTFDRFKQAYHFMRKGKKLIRIERLAREKHESEIVYPVEILKGEKYEYVERYFKEKIKYLIIPKSLIDDLILRVETDSVWERRYITMETRTYVRLLWIDPEFFVEIAPILTKEKLLPHVHEEHVTFAEVKELLNFEVDEGDRIKLKREIIEKASDKRSMIALAGRLFEGEFESEHNLLCKILMKVAEGTGCSAEREYVVGKGMRIDVAWFCEGRMTHAFEVVVGGSVKEALYRLNSIKNVMKVLVIEDRRVDEIKDVGDVKVIKASRIRAAEASLDEYLKLVGELRGSPPTI